MSARGGASIHIYATSRGVDLYTTDFNKDSHSNTKLLPDCLVWSDIIPSNETLVFEAEAEEEEEDVSLSESRSVELKTRSENGGVPLDLMAPSKRDYQHYSSA